MNDGGHLFQRDVFQQNRGFRAAQNIRRFHQDAFCRRIIGPVFLASLGKGADGTFDGPERITGQQGFLGIGSQKFRFPKLHAAPLLLDFQIPVHQHADKAHSHQECRNHCSHGLLHFPAFVPLTQRVVGAAENGGTEPEQLLIQIF